MRKWIKWVAAAATILAAGAGASLHAWQEKPEYFLLNRFEQQATCELVRRDGILLKAFPGNFCHFLGNGGFISGFWSSTGSQGLFFFDSSQNLIWNARIPLHHDLQVYEDKKQIFLLSRRTKVMGGRKIKDELVLGYDFSGKEIYRWSVLDHWKDFQPTRLLPIPDKSYPGELTHISHLNSVQLLPANSVAGHDPRFAAGNLLVNCFLTGQAFVIERATGKITWRKQFPTPVHTVRLHPNGKIVYFRNLAPNGEKSSRLEALDPLSGEVELLWAPPADGRYFSVQQGGLDVMPNGNLLATFSSSASAVEFDMKEKKVIWRWNNPRIQPNENSPGMYRLTYVPSGLAETALRRW
jgi:hypothetical protein